MATVDEIFESMAEISDELEESVDSAILIDPNTRQISLPGAELIFGVESDGKSERKYFLCPRYVGNNLDLAACFIRVNYRNANGEVDAHLVNDVRVVGDSVMFSWELAEKVTLYMGQVKFVVCAIHGDHEWHTTVSTGVVLEGLEPDGEAIAGATDDAIAQLLTLVDAQSAKVTSEGTKQVASVQAAAEASRIAVEASIEAKGTATLASIPEDYQTLSNDVYGLKKTRATAIICEATGTTVAVNDASDNPLNGLRIFGRSTQDGVPTPDSPVDIVSVVNPTVTVCGRNIIPYPYDEGAVTQNGMTLTPQADGGIAVTGTPTGYVDMYLYDGPPLAKNGNITVSIHGTFENVTASLGFHDAAGATIGSVNAIPEGRNYITVNLDDYPTAARWIILIKRIENNLPVSGVIYPKVELGEIASAYEPYVSGAIATQYTLLGIPVTEGGNYIDENGQRWICDEVDLERGVYVQRIAKKTLTETDITSVGSGYFEYGTYAYTTVRDAKAISTDVVVISDKLLGIRADRRSGFIHDSNYRCYAQDGVVYLRFPAGTGEKTLAECKTAFAGATVQYALATPVETPLSDVEIASYRAIRTVFPNTTILNSAGAHMIVDYAADTKSYIDNLLKG